MEPDSHAMDVLSYYNRIVAAMPDPKPEYYSPIDREQLELAREVLDRAEKAKVPWDDFLGAAFAMNKFFTPPALKDILKRWMAFLDYYRSTAGSIGLQRLRQYVAPVVPKLSPGFEIVKQRLARAKRWDWCRQRKELTGGWAEASPACQVCPVANGCRYDRVSVHSRISAQDRSPGSGGG